MLDNISDPGGAIVFFAIMGALYVFTLRPNHRKVEREKKRKEDEEREKKRKEDEELKKQREQIQKRKVSVKNINKYREYTKKRDWSGIFCINNTTIDAFGTKKELNVLGDYLEEGEVVFALVSGVMSQSTTSNDFDFGLNTWIAALTSERVLCLDHALLSYSVDTQSIRLNKIQAVSASQGWKFGKVIIDIGNRMIKVDNCVKEHVPVFADLANQLLRAREVQQVQSVNKGSNLVNDLERLKKLKEAGVLNEEEFVLAKQKIMNA